MAPPLQSFCTQYVTVCFNGQQFGWDFGTLGLWDFLAWDSVPILGVDFVHAGYGWTWRITGWLRRFLLLRIHAPKGAVRSW